MEYLRQEWNSPSRTDYYLMQLALEVVRSRLGKNPGRVKLDQFELEFKTDAPHARTPEERAHRAKTMAEQAKAVWRQRLNLPKGKPHGC